MSELRLAASHLDCFLDQLHIHPLAIDFVLVRVRRVDLLDVQVLDIRADVGEAPGDAVIVTDDHARCAGKGHAGDLIRTISILLEAMQTDLIPDGGHLSPQVRVVGEQGQATGGALTGDNPVIRTDPSAQRSKQGFQLRQAAL